MKYIRFWLLLFLVSNSIQAWGQATTLTLSANPQSVKPGQLTTLTLTLSGVPSVSALQWKIGLPITFVGVQAATAVLTGAQKQLSCSAVTCLAWGLNVTAIPNGAIVTIPITIPANITPGPIQVSLTNILGSSATGLAVPVTGVATTITITSSYDINNDGQVTATDVNAIVAQVVSGTCTSDVNGSGKCDVFQVIEELKAWILAGSKP